MRAVLVNPDSFLQQRRRLDMDKFDEMWDGEWHFVNPPRRWHPRLSIDLSMVLAPLALKVGLQPYGDSTGVFAGTKNWRVPDQVYVRPDHEVDEGVTGAELAVELRSPGDESYAKMPFYASLCITEMLIIHEDRRFELFRLDETGAYQPVADGQSTVLGVTFSTVDGPKLRITWDGGSADV